MVEEMTSGERQMAVAEPTPIYEIRIAGRLEAAHWQSWFEGMTVVVDEDARETILYGPVYDQAALYGLLSRVRDMALTLRSVRLVEEDPRDVAGWRRARRPGGRGRRWLMALAYLFVAGGLAAMTVFLTSDAGLDTALALTILFLALTAVEVVFLRADGGRGWLVVGGITAAGAAITLIVYLLSELVPVALGLGLLFLLVGGGLVYALVGPQLRSAPAERNEHSDPASRDVGRDG